MNTLKGTPLSIFKKVNFMLGGLYLYLKALNTYGGRRRGRKGGRRRGAREEREKKSEQLLWVEKVQECSRIPWTNPKSQSFLLE